MKNKYLRVISIMVFVSILFIRINFPSELWANDRYDFGYPVQATPFDGKLARAGFFDEHRPDDDQPRRLQSVESLFLIARSFRYVHETTNNRWQTVDETSSQGSGDCADKAVWLYVQLKRNGYDEVRLIIGKYRSFDSKLHAWVVYTDAFKNTYILDPTIQRKPAKTAEFSEGFYVPFYSFYTRPIMKHLFKEADRS